MILEGTSLEQKKKTWVPISALSDLLSTHLLIAQVLRITRSDDMVKLRALAKLCSLDFFDDQSLLVVAWRRNLEVLELAMPEEKKVRGKKKEKKKKNDPKKLEVFDTSFALGRVCNMVGDADDARQYVKRAKEGYEEQRGRDSEKALEVTLGLIMVTCLNRGELVEKLRDLVKRMEKVLGEENEVTLKTPNSLGVQLKDNGEYEEAKELHERCLMGRMKLFDKDHPDTLATLNNLGCVYDNLKNYEKALEYYERALKGSERMLEKNHPETLVTLENIAVVYKSSKDYGKAEELYETALEGYEAQLGKDRRLTKHCTKFFKICLEKSGDDEKRLEELKQACP